MPACFQRLAGLPALLFLALLLPGCTCGDAKPMTLPNPGVPVPRPFTMPPLVPGPVPAGATVSRSGFDGGPFAAVLPVPPRTSPPSPAEVLDQIEPVLRAAGFHRSLSDLSGPGEPLQLPRPDLKSLSAEVCREPAARQSPSQVALCETLSSGGPPYPKADEAIRNAYGVGYTEWKASLERLSFQYPFSQVVGGVPIDGAGISVFRQENGSLALIHGSLFDRFTVVNKVPGEQSSALVSAALALLARPPEERLGRRRLDLSLPVQAGEPSLVLIPDGTVGQGSETVPALRYAWRVLVGIAGRHESWMVWIDAELGNLLRVASQAKDAATISAVRWRRDPGLCLAGTLSCTELVPFEVDDADNKGMVTLQLANVFEQVENPTGDNLKISSAGFNQPPVNNAATAVCPSGDNSAFRQINVYSHLYSLWKILGGAGMAAIFPEKPVTVYVDYRDDSGGNSAFYDSSPGKTDARSELWFGDGKGFKDPLCPSSPGTRLSGSQDVTIPIHEMSHLFVQRLQERRPPTWCCTGCKTCSLPDTLGHNILHDFADSFAFSYTSTNCFAGWSAKNLGGEDASLNCKLSSEGGLFPRKAELPMDRFPEHRLADRGEYGNGQIAAAALWEVRKSLRSKSLIAGTDEYWVHLLRALWKFGSVHNTCSYSDFYPNTTRLRYNSCDRDVFLYLQDLERQMVGEWALAGPFGQTASKVVSGFAKAGIYLVPLACLDGRPDTSDPIACPQTQAQTALDAVIEIDDGQDGDDLPLDDNAVQPEGDYLSAAGPPPSFRIWTGPHYWIESAAAGTANTTGAPLPLCGDRYRVELAANDSFQPVLLNIPGPTGSKPCEGEAKLSQGAWQSLQSGLAGGKIYYRVWTWKASAPNDKRVSTSPGGGAFQIPAPFAVVNTTGKP